jgi:hypothetical protein
MADNFFFTMLVVLTVFAVLTAALVVGIVMFCLRNHDLLCVALSPASLYHLIATRHQAMPTFNKDNIGVGVGLAQSVRQIFIGCKPKI